MTLKELQAENACLKAEVEMLTNESDIFEKCCEHQKNRIERLKAEVEELKLENSQYEEHHKCGQNVITSLRDEVERLTKAGEWKPIATAPKDGTDILIAYRDGYFGCMSVTLTCWGETSWRHLFSNEYITDTPTYWMPAPLAPANEENDKL